MATVGNLWINVKSNTAGLEKGLKKSRGLLGRFAKFAVSPAGLAIAGFAALTAGIYATIRAISSAIGEFRVFDKAMSGVKAVMKDVSPEGMQKLTELAKELGRTTQFTATQAAEGMSILARAGFKDFQIYEALPAVLDLASASSMEMAQSADILALAMGGFGADASEATHFADVFAVGANSVNTTVAEMGEAMQHVAPIAKQLGFTFEETSAMIAGLQDSGIKGAKAGTALRVVMAELGAEIEGNGKQALQAYLKEGHSFTGNLDKFGKLGVNAVGILQSMTDETAALTKEMTSADGVVKQMAETNLDNLDGDITKFSSAVSGLKIELGEKLEPTFRAIVQVATEFVSGVQAAFESVMGGSKESIISMDTLRDVFKGIARTIITIGVIVLKVYNIIAFVINSIKMILAGLLTYIAWVAEQIVMVVAWALDFLGIISTESYDQITTTMSALTDELSKTTEDAAKAAAKNFEQGLLGGVEEAGDKVFNAFAQGMDGAGKNAADALSSSFKKELKIKSKEINEGLTGVADSLLKEWDSMTASLQEQVKFFGMTRGEILQNKIAYAGLTYQVAGSVVSLERRLEVLKAEKKAQDDATSAIEQKAASLKSASLSIIESLKTPKQLYAEEQMNLQAMFDAKLLTLTQFSLALEKLRMDSSEDVSINIVSKGVVEGLQTALGTINIAGETSKTEQLAAKSISVQKNMTQVMSAVSSNTSGIQNGINEVADTLGSTLFTEIKGLEGIIEKGVSNATVGVKGMSLDKTEDYLDDIKYASERTQEESTEQTKLLKQIASGGGGLT